MPDRVVRGAILTSDAVNKLSWGAEVFYRRLMSVADDFGRYDGRVSVLRGSLYALKLSKAPETDIQKWMEECTGAGLIKPYQVEGRKYVEIVKFKQRLRSMNSKYPPPADICPQPADIRGHLSADDSRPPPETEAEADKEVESETVVVDARVKFFKKNLLEDQRFVENMLMAHKIEEEVFTEAVDQFFLRKERNGDLEKWKNENDCKNHFMNWLPGFLSRLNETKQKIKNGALKGRYSKTDGTEFSEEGFGTLPGGRAN